MTKTFLATIAGAFALTVLSASAQAQTSSRMDFAKTVTTMTGHTAAEGVIATGEMSPAMVSNKALRSFSKNFKGVTPQWYPNKDQYLARFSEGGALTHVLYEKNGYMVYSVTKGSARILPAEVVSLLEEMYPCYSIATATKAVSQGSTAWIADLKKDNTLLVVRVVDGDIVETTRYRTNSH